MLLQPRLILAQQGWEGISGSLVLGTRMGQQSILCHRPGQVPQPPSASIPWPRHDPGLSHKTIESTPANYPEILA